MRCIIYSPHWLRMYFAFVGREGKLYTYTGVGLSALLVSTYRAMREPTDCGTSDRMALRFFLVYYPIYELSCKSPQVLFVLHMNNEMQWSSATPGLLVILIDQSGSMLFPMESPNEKETRTTVATKAVNRVIDTIIQKNFDGKAPKNRCFISVIGYNHEVKNLTAGYLKDLDENPIRVDKVKQKISDGAGGILGIEKSMPIWVDPIKEDGGTNMKGAFEMAKEIIEKWISDKPNNPAPVIINISDGVPYFNCQSEEECKTQTIEVVNQIKAIDTTDGKVQIFNAMIGNGSKTMFPASKEEISTDEGKFLYDISTEIPDSYKGAAEKNGFTYKSGARGLICQCDGVELVGLIDFGSSKGQGDI